MINHEVLPNYRSYETPQFKIETLKIESSILRSNPLQDPATRFNPVLVPHVPGPWPVVVILSGFTSNAPFNFNGKFNEKNPVQIINEAAARGEAPQALYVFVDALTTWGGSQFINSSAVGNYEDYIMQELIPAVKKHFTVSDQKSDWCVTGGSSGGYGALHLGSKYPEVFGVIAAIAPDSFFEASLLSEFYQTAPLWEKYQSGLKALEELRNGRLTKMRNWHTLLNAFGMAACYAPKGEHGDFHFPLEKDGTKNSAVWKTILEKDPLHFLPQRLSALKNTAVYLDVGNKDNFHLQYGCRQISELFKKNSITHDYIEFDGNHFDIGERRIEVWRWLSTQWRR